MKIAIISFLIEPAAMVLTFALWYGFVAVGLRAVGIRLPIVIWRYSAEQRDAQPGRFAFIAVQATLLGGWFYLADIVEDYVRTKVGLSTPFHAYGYSVFHAFSSLALGAWFGWVMWKNSPWSNPYAHFDRLSINPEARDLSVVAEGARNVRSSTT